MPVIQRNNLNLVMYNGKICHREKYRYHHFSVHQLFPYSFISLVIQLTLNFLPEKKLINENSLVSVVLSEVSIRTVQVKIKLKMNLHFVIKSLI